MDIQTFWKKYFDANAGRQPAKILRIQLEKYSFPKNPKALDIGAGDLVDSIYLMEQGFDVTALDPSDASAEFAAHINNSLFHYIKNDLQHSSLPEEGFDLIISFMTLSHIPKNEFHNSIKKIQSLAKGGGLFIANFFGLRDGWNTQESHKSFVDIAGVQNMFENFDIIFLNEREYDDTYGFAQITGTNDIKHWHIITLVARKK